MDNKDFSNRLYRATSYISNELNILEGLGGYENEVLSIRNILKRILPVPRLASGTHYSAVIEDETFILRRQVVDNYDGYTLSIRCLHLSIGDDIAYKSVMEKGYNNYSGNRCKEIFETGKLISFDEEDVIIKPNKLTRLKKLKISDFGYTQFKYQDDKDNKGVK